MNFDSDTNIPDHGKLPREEIVPAQVVGPDELVEPAPPLTTDHGDPNSPQSLSIGGILAWIIIATITLGVFALIAAGSKLIDSPIAPRVSSTELAQIELQGKLQVAQEQLTGKSSVGLPEELDVGPYAQRLCYTILINEKLGSAAALEHLKTTDQRLADANLKLSHEQLSLRNSIESLLNNYTQGNFETDELSPDEKQRLEQRLGWFGELILAPVETKNQALRHEVIGSATTSLYTVAGAMLVGVLAAIAGFIVLVVLIVLTINGKLKSRFDHQTSRHNLYVQTFAIWMVIFFVGQIPFGLLLPVIGLHDELSQMKAMPVLFFGSLLALAWPVLRGVSFSQVREDIGWNFGNPIVEGGVAGIGYASILPVLALAVMAMVILLSQFGPQQSPHDFTNSGGPSHPIQEYIADGNLAVFAVIVFMACVAAPIVEETMFRGVFYRHLRDLSAGWSKGLSIALACLINSFVFASIHPQGLFGIPMLMTLAIGFSLVREWRGSLLAPMLMHATNNFLVTVFAFFAM